MTTPHYQELGDGIYCIDTRLYRHGMVACYLIESQGRLALVDTGTSPGVPDLLELLDRLGFSPAQMDYVMPTHVHLDHAGGSGALMAACPNARLVTHPKGVPHLIDPARLTAGALAVYGAEAFARDFGELLPVAAERVIAAADGQSFPLGERLLTVLDSPGHANHHCCIFDSQSQGLFTGDTFGISYRELDTDQGPFLFAPTTPVAFDPDAWQTTLDRLMSRQPSAVYLTHFGRLEAPERLVDGLRASIQGLADLALAEESAPDPERPERLRQAVAALFLEEVRAHGCTLPDPEIRRVLAVDTELNAQGLEVWLQRRAKSVAH